MNRRIFLIDALGAMLSTLLLFILSLHETTFGMPPWVIYQLIPIPFLLVLYSLTVYLLKPIRWNLFLRIIATANLIYCLVTLFLVIQFMVDLTLYGKIYFVTEMVLIIILSIFELSISRKNFHIHGK